MSDTLPLLLRAARGEAVERPPVWMMRQAGRYMKIYRDLRDKYPSFRERSENPDLSYEISMQPFHAFQPDGVTLFCDILTPLPAMGADGLLSLVEVFTARAPAYGCAAEGEGGARAAPLPTTWRRRNRRRARAGAWPSARTRTRPFSPSCPAQMSRDSRCTRRKGG